MIEYRSGDILESGADAIVNTVNCVGVMGRGIALQFKNAYPENFRAYAAACRRGEVWPGRMFAFETGQLSPRLIVNFPTKRHWRAKSRIEDIDAGLAALVELILARQLRSIALPPLGSGLGGLDWDDEVRPRIEAALDRLDGVRIIVYEPTGAPASDLMHHRREAPRMTAGRAALVELMHRYLGGLLDPFVTLLEVHKLMYFLQEAGEPLRLRYRQAPYGPYAENLRHVLNAIDGHLIAGYDDVGDMPDKPLSIVPGAVEDAAAFIARHPETRARFDRVVSLVEGFESPFGLELLSTVHWVMHRDRVRTLDDVVARTYAWNERKRQFTARQIGIAADVLTAKGWVMPLEQAALRVPA